MIYSDVPPSQGGKYTGFGNSTNPPPRSFSSNDFMDMSVNGLTNVSFQDTYLYNLIFKNESP